MKAQVLKFIFNQLLLFLAIFSLAFSNGFYVSAKTAYSQADVDRLNQIAAQKKAQAALQEKNKQLIQNQINSLNNQINQTTAAIQTTAQKIDATQSQVDNLKIQITLKEADLSNEKTKLNQFVAAWYMEGSPDLFETVLSANSLSEITDKQEYNDSVRQQIGLNIEHINQMKTELDKQKKEADDQLQTLNGLKNDQLARQDSLQASQKTKNSLLNYTQSTINQLNSEAQQYQEQAKKIAAMLVVIYGGGSPVGSDLKSSPDWWYWSQRDPRWSGVDLSPYSSEVNIGNYGCLVTSLAMVANFYHSTVTPANVVEASRFTGDGSFLGFNGDVGITIAAAGRVNWDVVNSELANNHPVIVSVYTGRGQAYNADGSNHFIVIRSINNGVYQIQDPYWQNSSYNISQVRSMKVVRSD